MADRRAVGEPVPDATPSHGRPRPQRQAEKTAPDRVRDTADSALGDLRHGRTHPPSQELGQLVSGRGGRARKGQRRRRQPPGDGRTRGPDADPLRPDHALLGDQRGLPARCRQRVLHPLTRDGGGALPRARPRSDPQPVLKKLIKQLNSPGDIPGLPTPAGKVVPGREGGRVIWTEYPQPVLKKLTEQLGRPGDIPRLPTPARETMSSGEGGRVTP